MGTKVTWVGEPGLEEYNGSDGDKPLNIGPGQTVEVSDEKAAQLEADFAHLVSVDGGKPARKTAPVTPPAEVEEDDTTDEAAVDASDAAVVDEDDVASPAAPRAPRSRRKK